jgi:hypothetical protein
MFGKTIDSCQPSKVMCRSRRMACRRWLRDGTNAKVVGPRGKLAEGAQGSCQGSRTFKVPDRAALGRSRSGKC